VLLIDTEPLYEEIHQQTPGQQGSNLAYNSPCYSFSASILQSYGILLQLTTSQEFFAMAPPSKLAVATSSVLRLVKEEASYHKEIEQQEARIKKLEKSLEEGNAEDNAEFQLNQDVSERVGVIEQRF
jgi:hypothetical protein